MVTKKLPYNPIGLPYGMYMRDPRPEVKKITPRYELMFCCEICIHCKQLQRTLIFWRNMYACNKSHYNSLVFPDDNILHLSPRDTINGLLCSKQFGSSLPKWKCILRQYASCPKYTVPGYESIYITVPSRIKFHQYILFST